MITLHVLQWLADQGHGTIDTDLFWEQVPVGKQGVAIISRGGAMYRGRRASQDFDLYARGTSDLQGADQLEKIWQSITDDGVVCDLPQVPGKSLKTYNNTRIWPQGNLENLGLDENDRLLWRWSYSITYDKE